MNSSAVEHLVYTEAVGGSIPSSSICILLNVKIKQSLDELIALKDILSLKEFYQIQDEFQYTQWDFNKKENTESDAYPRRGELRKPKYGNTLGDNITFLNIGSRLKLHVEKILRKKIELRRINTNIQFFGQHSSFHKDSTTKSAWTLIIFCNKIWDTNWGGEFVIQNNEGDYSYVPYIPNTGVLIPAWLEHQGLPPSRLCNSPRISLAFTYREIVV